jgi:hypothetical protein
MGYSTNPELVEKHRELLARLEAGETCRWLIKGGWDETRRTAFAIRQGLKIAGMYPQRFPALASAAAKFSIHIVARGTIEARVRSIPSVETAPAPARAVQHGLEPFGRDVPSVGLTTAQEIIEAWRVHQPSNDPLRFTSTVLSTDELIKLYAWATGRAPKLMILVGEHNQTLVLTLHDMSTKAYAWTPGKKKKEVEVPGWKPPKLPEPKEEFDL